LRCLGCGVWVAVFGLRCLGCGVWVSWCLGCGVWVAVFGLPCLGCGVWVAVFGLRCLGCAVFGLRCLGRVVFGVRGVWVARCLGCAVFGSRGFGVARCLGCAVFGLRGVWVLRNPTKSVTIANPPRGNAEVSGRENRPRHSRRYALPAHQALGAQHRRSPSYGRAKTRPYVKSVISASPATADEFTHKPPALPHESGCPRHILHWNRQSAPRRSGAPLTKPGCSGLWVQRCLGAPVFGCSGLWMLRSLGAAMFGCSGLWVVRSLGAPVFGCSDVWVLRSLGAAMFGCSGASLCLFSPILTLSTIQF
jgi:hypothetical protein